MRTPFFYCSAGTCVFWHDELTMSLVPPPLQSALVWAAWCCLHSLLISSGWTRMLRALLGRRFAWYRISYAVFSLLTLTLLVIWHFSLKQDILFSWHGWWRLPQAALFVYAGFMVQVGWRRYDLRYFLGISQVADYYTGREMGAPVFAADDRGGVRHPWYSGGIALVWAAGPLTDVSLATKLVVSAYLIIGACLEEKKLLAQFGSDYAEYRRRLPMFIPRRRR